MPRLSATGLTWKDRAIAGSAVTITVPSNISMNRAPATSIVTARAARVETAGLLAGSLNRRSAMTAPAETRPGAGVRRETA